MQSSTELEALSGYSTVVPDTYLMQDLQKLEMPKAATVTSAVLSGILRSPTGFQEYEARHNEAYQFPCEIAVYELKAEHKGSTMLVLQSIRKSTLNYYL